MTGSLDRVPPRSFLFAPGDSDRLLAKVVHAGADAVVLDLEDAVPTAQKSTARQRVRDWLANVSRTDSSPEIWVRINALDSPYWADDLRAVAQPGLTGVRIPKCETPESLARLDENLLELEAGTTLGPRTLLVTATVESARGLASADVLAASPRVVQLAFGEADFVADIGAAPVPEATLYARSQLVLASRLAGILPPIAPVYTRLDDDDGLEASSLVARNMGFGGRSCIHPRQLPTIHRVFTPSPDEIDAARAVIEASQCADGGAAMDGQDFVDEAVVRRARSVLKRAMTYGVVSAIIETTEVTS